MGNGYRLNLKLTPGEFIAWIFRRRERFNVRGLSMQPFLQPHQDVLLKPVQELSHIEVGDIIVAHDPRDHTRLLIKQVSRVTDTGVEILGTNPDHSTDSRQFGLIPLDMIKGKVTVILG